MYILIFSILAICINFNTLEQNLPAGKNDTIEYYRDIDLINLEPLWRVETVDNLPYVKVIRGHDGIKSMDVYIKNKKAPDKTYKRIAFKGWKAFSSGSSRLGWKSVDTLVVFNNSMIEFRSCYSTTTKVLNEQEILYYTPAGKDTIQLSYLSLINLYENPNAYQAADTSLQVFNLDRNAKYVSQKEDFYIARIGGRFKITCKTRTTPWCNSGYQDQQSYPFIRSFYWSLFNAPYWELSK